MIGKEAIIIDHTNLVLITDPNDELIDLVYKSYMYINAYSIFKIQQVYSKSY